MGTVFLVQAPGVASVLQARGNQVHQFTASNGLDEAFQRLGADVDGVILGAEVADPIQSVQRSYRLDPNVTVVLLCEGAQCDKLEQALRFSPFIGNDVTCSDVNRPDLADLIEQGVQRTRLRRRHRTTVVALETQRASLQSRTTGAAERDVFATQLLDVAPIAILSMDEQGRVAAANLEAARLFSTSERELLGTPLGPKLGPDQGAWEELLTAARAGRSTATFAVDDTVIEASAVALRPHGGLLLVLQDITERRRAAEARELALQRAEEANRLKDEFVAMISHELRTPLNAVVGWTRLLRSGALPADKVAHALEVIERNAESQVRLVEDLLDLSRIVAGKLRLDVRPVNVGDILRQAVDSVQVAAGARRLTVLTDIEDDLPEMSADPERLQQVFWNLLSNAVKFTPKEGLVSARAFRHGSLVRIEISDDGEGIRSEALPFVFDPFRQAEGGTTRAHGGLGLGLAVVRRLVELHGGSVSAHSDGVGKGATFTIDMPIGPLRVQADDQDEMHSAARNSVSRTSLPPLLAGITVLVVDDEPDARELVAMLIDGAGGRSRTAASSAEAMTVLDQESVDAIVSDVGMPDEDGYAFVRRVRALAEPTCRIPVLALTAYAREQERALALAAGFDAHLSKPITPDELVGWVSRVLSARSAPDS